MLLRNWQIEDIPVSELDEVEVRLAGIRAMHPLSDIY